MPLSVTKGQGEPSGGGEDHQMTVYSKAENGQNGTAVNPGEQAGAERVMNLRRLCNEVETKAVRRMLAGSFIRYLFFVGLYLLVLHYQKSAEPSFYLTDAVRRYYAEAPYVDVKKGHSTFNDMTSVGDFWNWMDGRFMPNTYESFWSNGDPKDSYFKGAILDRNRLLSGFRMTQRRSKINDCLLQQRFNAFFPFCYPNTYGEGRVGAQDTSTFGPYFNTQKYKYTSFSYPGGDSDSGFVVNFNADAATALKQVAELKADRWIDQSTRWVRVDMAMYNPSANLFSHVEFSVEFDNTGKLWPRTRVTTMKTEAYLNITRDYIQIVLEIVLMIGIILYVVSLIKNIAESKARRGSFSSYFTSFWNWIEFALVFLFFLDFCVWIAVIADPVRNNLKLQLGPAAQDVAGTPTGRDVTKDTLTIEGQPLSLAPLRGNLELYWNLQSVTMMIVMMQFFKYMAFNSFLGTLVETFMVVKTVILQYIIIVVISNVGFAYMGYCMFGHALAEFYSFDQSFMTLLGTSLGDGITYAELVEVNPTGGPLLYVPFVIFNCFILLNMIIAVIVEGYQVQQSQRARHVSLWHQMRYGLARSVPSFRRYIPREDQWRYKGPDNVKIKGWLEDIFDDEEALDREVSEDEMVEMLLEKNVRLEDVQFIFKRYSWCTRPRDPPAPEPAVNDMVRELHRVIKALADSQSVAQRKLDAIIAGQDM